MRTPDFALDADPFETPAHVAGAKLDAGKPESGTVLRDFRGALRLVSDVGTFGIQKYSRGSWKSVPEARRRYLDAAFRHLLADGDTDPESGLPHLAHAAWCLLAILQFEQDRKTNTEGGINQ